MYIRFHAIKGRHGQVYPYLKLVYSQRRDGKVRQERVCSLGRVEELQKVGAIDRMIAKLSTAAKHRWVRAEALKLGTPWIREYGPVLLMRRLWRNLGLEEIIAELQRPNSLYCSLDFLAEHMGTIEEALFGRVRDLFSLNVKLVLFDTTSTYFEGGGPEELAELAKR
jgi:hypothetical protein